jgi:hypothetical protein
VEVSASAQELLAQSEQFQREVFATAKKTAKAARIARPYRSQIKL